MNNHNLPRMEAAVFRGAYPLAEIDFACRDLPLRVRLQAFKPPGPRARSTTPAFPRRCCATASATARPEPVEASIAFSLPNFIGADRSPHEPTCYAASHAYGPRRNLNEARRGDGLRGLFLRSEGVPANHPARGTMALATTAETCSHRTAWADLSWGNTLLDFWDDLTADGAVDERASGRDDPMATLCPRVTVAAGGEAEILFLLTWHFSEPPRLGGGGPHRRGGRPAVAARTTAPRSRIPSSSATTTARSTTTPWDVAARANRPARRPGGRAPSGFVSDFLAADVPAAIREAALFNLSTLRTQTCLRTADGHFFGWEGCHDTQGCCRGSCTHVLELRAGPRLRLRRAVPQHAPRRVRPRHHRPRAGADAHRPAPPPAPGAALPRRRRRPARGDHAVLPGLAAERLPGAVRRPLAAGEGRHRVLLDRATAGTPTGTASWRAASTTPWTWSTSAPTRRWGSGTSGPCAPARRWPAMPATPTSPSAAGPCSSPAGPGWRSTCSTASTSSTASSRPAPAPPSTRGSSATRTAATSTTRRCNSGPPCLVDQLVGQYIGPHVCGLGDLVDPGPRPRDPAQHQGPTTGATPSSATSTTSAAMPWGTRRGCSWPATPAAAGRGSPSPTATS